MAYSYSPIQVLKRVQWKTVSAGRSHSAGLGSKGEAIVWGDNSKGQHFQAVATTLSTLSTLPFLRLSEQLTSIHASDDHTVLLTSAAGVYLSFPAHPLAFHLPKQFALTGVTTALVNSDGLYCLGNNGGLFYAERATWSRAREHYVMQAIGKDVEWMREGAGLVAGSNGRMYELIAGTMSQLTGIYEARGGSTNSKAYSALLPTYSRPYTPVTGLLPLSTLIQHHLISSLVLFT